jgi:hypothetical protein
MIVMHKMNINFRKRGNDVKLCTQVIGPDLHQMIQKLLKKYSGREMSKNITGVPFISIKINTLQIFAIKLSILQYNTITKDDKKIFSLSI